MKKVNCACWMIALSASLAHAQRGTLNTPAPRPQQSAPPIPKVWEDTNYQPPEWSASRTPVTPGETFVYQQKQYGGRAPLTAPEQSQGIIDRFKAAYPKLGSPRILLYVNRDLVNEHSGMKLTHGTQHIESTKHFGNTGTNEIGSVKTSTDQSFRMNETSQPTLADKQTVRDIERLFGRPLRQAGASVVDQKVAAQLIADKSITDFIGATDTPEARRDREAIGRIADVVIEVLVSSKTVVVPTISDSQTVTIPDIQATAISLKDSKIIGQAASADATNRVLPASLASFSVPEITETTALALMEDMASEVK